MVAMRWRQTVAASLAAAMFFASASVGFAETAPDRGAGEGSEIGAASLATSAWPMFGHDLQHTRLSTCLGAQTNTVKWTRTTGDWVESSPAVGSDGTIYVGSFDCKVYALNPSDGSVKWTHTTDGAVYSSPAIGSDGTIYVGGTDWNVYALNPADGSEKWVRAMDDQVDCSPAIGSDGTVYIGSMAGLVYALDPDNGSAKWARDIGGGGWLESSPAIGSDGTVYIGSDDNNVYALNPEDGTVKWTRATGDDVVSSPAIGSDGTVYVGSNDGKVYALYPDDGSVKWTRAKPVGGGWVECSPAIGSDGTLYLWGGDASFYALNSANGSVKWSRVVTGASRSCPAIGSDGTVYVGADGSDRVLAFGGKPSYSTKLTLSGASSVYRGRAYKLSGSISPAVAGTKVKIVWKRYYSGAYRTVKTVYATISGGKFSCSYKPTTRGRWRAYVSYGGQTTTAAVYKAAPTVFKSFTVK
jgi:outer membrane protein assembly factor BamB